ncbi:MAG: AAA family ATPase [Puniceicoccales bacterium]|jgi:ATP-dependent exoDNAse (exonuclease V) alpha subunit|nr:AAA family ATPase [Puniceicoccales bacterium]
MATRFFGGAFFSCQSGILPSKTIYKIRGKVDVDHAITEEQSRAYGELLMGHSVMLLGPAGTGKSEFIRHVRKTMPGRMAVLAPTGMAAMNAGLGAVTIHSLFSIPPVNGGYFDVESFTIRRRTAKILKGIDYLVVDEISMVRPDLFDLMESMARRARGKEVFFGGICLLLVGDFHQLPPVIRSEERDLFAAHYGSGNAYLFDAKCLRGRCLSVVQLSKIFRQSSEKFLAILGCVGGGRITEEILRELNGRVLGGATAPKGALTVTPYRESAEQKNHRELEALPGVAREYVGEKTGTFQSANGDDLPSPEVLSLKEGASVIFTCNASNGEWVNGTGATVLRLGQRRIDVAIRRGGSAISISPHEWSHIIPDGDGYEITGTYRQIPLRLGYALTVHKIQGKTCDAIVLQRDRSFFAHGQLYVALSRATSLDAVYLTDPIRASDVKIDRRVIEFYENLSADGPILFPVLPRDE